MSAPLPRVKVYETPPGQYASGGRSPIVWVYLCAPCAGYAPITPEDYHGALSGRCAGCGTTCRELHRFQAVIDSVSGCGCSCQHAQVIGDLPRDVAIVPLSAQIPGLDPTHTAFAGGVYADWDLVKLNGQVMDPQGARQLASSLLSAAAWAERHAAPEPYEGRQS